MSVIEKDYNEIQKIQIQKYSRFVDLFYIVVHDLYEREEKNDFLEDIYFMKDDDKRNKLINELLEQNVFGFSEIETTFFFIILKELVIIRVNPEHYDVNTRAGLLDELIGRIYSNDCHDELIENYMEYLLNEYGIEFESFDPSEYWNRTYFKINIDNIF